MLRSSDRQSSLWSGLVAAGTPGAFPRAVSTATRIFTVSSPTRRCAGPRGRRDWLCHADFDGLRPLLQGVARAARRRSSAACGEFRQRADGVFADVLQETMLATYRRGGIARAGTVGFIALKRNVASFRRLALLLFLAHPAAPWLLPRAPDQAPFTRRFARCRTGLPITATASRLARSFGTASRGSFGMSLGAACTR